MDTIAANMSAVDCLSLNSGVHGSRGMCHANRCQTEWPCGQRCKISILPTGIAKIILILPQTTKNFPCVGGGIILPKAIVFPWVESRDETRGFPEIYRSSNNFSLALSNISLKVSSKNYVINHKLISGWSASTSSITFIKHGGLARTWTWFLQS